VFPIPEDNLPPVMAKVRAAAKMPVDAYDRADKVKLATGMLLTADNQIDPATGTVKLKAIFANFDNALFPSQFANVRMLLDVKRGVTLVPSAAVQRGTPGTFVYVINEGNTASVRKVVLGPAQGEFTSIESGLAPGEMVVVDGADKLREGARVEVTGRDGAGKGGPRRGGGGEGRSKGGADAGAAPGGTSKGGDVKGDGKEDPARGDGAKGGPSPSAAAAKEGAQGAGSGGFQGMSPEERAKRWAELNARIDRGEFGDEIKKLPEEERKQRMREMRQKRDAAGGGAGKGAQ
jgi:multidrug efflux system membrane fusion protein